jgi:hypothetical protein
MHRSSSFIVIAHPDSATVVGSGTDDAKYVIPASRLPRCKSLPPLSASSSSDVLTFTKSVVVLDESSDWLVSAWSSFLGSSSSVPSSNSSLLKHAITNISRPLAWEEYALIFIERMKSGKEDSKHSSNSSAWSVTTSDMFDLISAENKALLRMPADKQNYVEGRDNAQITFLPTLLSTMHALSTGDDTTATSTRELSEELLQCVYQLSSSYSATQLADHHFVSYSDTIAWIYSSYSFICKIEKSLTHFTVPFAALYSTSSNYSSCKRSIQKQRN